MMADKCHRCPNLSYTSMGLCQKHADAARRKAGRVYVPSQPVAEHINYLRANGLGWGRIAELAGVKISMLRFVGQQKYTFANNAERILAVKPLVADGKRICNVGTQRRLQALVALGYTNRQLAKELDYPISQFAYLINLSEQGVTARVARKVEEVFDRLQLTIPPPCTGSTRAKNRAQRKGWPPPFAWDDDIDDPAATSNLGLKGCFMDSVEDGRNMGKSDKAIAEILGMQLGSFRQRVRRECA